MMSEVSSSTMALQAGGFMVGIIIFLSIIALFSDRKYRMKKKADRKRMEEQDRQNSLWQWEHGSFGRKSLPNNFISVPVCYKNSWHGPDLRGLPSPARVRRVRSRARLR